jgi:hypothetical protein
MVSLKIYSQNSQGLGHMLQNKFIKTMKIPHHKSQCVFVSTNIKQRLNLQTWKIEE